jgi:hypothetical protein
MTAVDQGVFQKKTSEITPNITKRTIKGKRKKGNSVFLENDKRKKN